MRSRIVLAAAAVLLLGGCALAKLAYTQSDWLFTDRVSELTALSGEQRGVLYERVKLVHSWHRTGQLPAYAEFIDELVANVDRGLSEDEARAIYERGRGYYQLLVGRLADAAAPSLVDLSPEQVILFEQNLEAENESFKERFAADELDERLEQRRERVIERVEQFVGDLTDAQREVVIGFSDRFPDSGPLWFDYRVAQQIRLLSLLRESRGEGPVRELLHGWYVRGDGRGARLEKMTEELEDNLAQLIVSVVSFLEPAQRAELKAELSAYAALARELASDG